MSTATKTSPTLSGMLRRIIRANKQTQDQIAAVADLLQSSEDMRKKYVERTWAALAADLVHSQRHAMRKLPTVSYLERNREAMVASGRRLGLFSDYFVGDKVLGDCTAADLKLAADRHERNAAGIVREAKFLLALADKCGTRKVKQAWKQEDAEKLKRSFEDQA